MGALLINVLCCFVFICAYSSETVLKTVNDYLTLGKYILTNESTIFSLSMNRLPHVISLMYSMTIILTTFQLPEGCQTIISVK